MLVLLPVALPLVRRAGPPLLALAALISVMAQLLSGASVRARLTQAFLHPAGLTLMGFFAWSTCTLLWSPLPARGLAQIVGCVVVFAAGLLVVVQPPPSLGVAFHRLFALSLSLGGVVVALDLLSGLEIASIVRSGEAGHRYNMVAVSLLLLCWGLSGRKDVSRAWGCLAWISVSAAIVISESEAAKLALAASAAAWAFAALTPRRASVALVGLCLLLCWLTAPWLGSVSDAVLPSKGGVLEAAHAQERIEIWRGGGLAAIAALPWGSGAGAALAFAEDAVRMGRFEGMGWGHPHNNFLQVWLELGAPGVLLGALASIAVWRAAAKLGRSAFQQTCGLVAAVSVVALVSHGLWQAWFWADICIAVFVLRLTAATELGRL
jgi:O-antigen ligase